MFLVRHGANPARRYAVYPPARFEILVKPCIFRMLAAMLALCPPLHITIYCREGSSSAWRVLRSCQGIWTDGSA